MRLHICCPSGLRISFDGDAGELVAIDELLAAIARHESDRLDPSSPSALGPAAEPAVGARPVAAPPPARTPRAPAAEGAPVSAGRPAYSHDRDRIHALVAEHGPTSYTWVADQLVLNRRDTLALMRQMTEDGQLEEQDAGGYYDIPDRDDQALAA